MNHHQLQYNDYSLNMIFNHTPKTRNFLIANCQLLPNHINTCAPKHNNPNLKTYKLSNLETYKPLKPNSY